MAQYRLLGAIASLSHINKNVIAQKGNYKF